MKFYPKFYYNTYIQTKNKYTKMEHTLGIYNGFGIMLTTNCVAAGLDFYIPLFKTEEQVNNFLAAIKKSYNIDNDVVQDLIKIIQGELSKYNYPNDYITTINVLHLFLSYKNSFIGHKDKHLYEIGAFFRHEILMFDDNGVPGISMHLNDTLLVNSGLKLNLEPGTAGIFFNKSGKGNQGFDIRACVVDEDYTGYVHLSIAFTKETPCAVYCGDKLMQMVILPVIHPVIKELTKNEYSDVTSDSTRGDKGFGSSDIKH